MYRDANGLDHESYDAACRYYGADTPSDLQAEAEALAAEMREELMDAMYAGVIQPGAHFSDDECPF